MFTILIILLVLRFIVLRNVDPAHWSRMCISISADVCMFIILGPILGTIWIAFRVWLIYRAFKLQKNKKGVI